MGVRGRRIGGCGGGGGGGKSKKWWLGLRFGEDRRWESPGRGG